MLCYELSLPPTLNWKLIEKCVIFFFIQWPTSIIVITNYEIRDFLFYLLIKHFLYNTIKCVEVWILYGRMKQKWNPLDLPFHSSLPLYILGRAHTPCIAEMFFFFEHKILYDYNELTILSTLIILYFGLNPFLVCMKMKIKSIEVVNLTKIFFVPFFLVWYIEHYRLFPRSLHTMMNSSFFFCLTAADRLLTNNVDFIC